MNFVQCTQFWFCNEMHFCHRRKKSLTQSLSNVSFGVHCAMCILLQLYLTAASIQHEYMIRIYFDFLFFHFIRFNICICCCHFFTYLFMRDIKRAYVLGRTQIFYRFHIYVNATVFYIYSICLCANWNDKMRLFQRSMDLSRFREDIIENLKYSVCGVDVFYNRFIPKYTQFSSYIQNEF